MIRFNLPRFSSFLLLAVAARAGAAVSLPGVFSDHMLLQRADGVAVWGWADPGETVKVSVAGASARVVTSEAGRWTATLSLAGRAPGPHVLTIEGRNRIEIADVLIGEVWLTAGQSNMELPLQQCTGSAEEIRTANFPEIRLYKGPHAPARQPQAKGEGKWMKASPETVRGFSAVGYYFAKGLHQELKVPVGIIDTSVGGTPVETWLSQAAVDSIPALRAGQQRFITEVDSYPERIRQFGQDFEAWLQAQQRADRPKAAPADFAAVDVISAGWQTIRLPAKFKDAGLPDAGAVWVRKDIDITPGMTGGPLRIDLGALKGYAAVYWNGTKIGETTHLGNPGGETKYSYSVPAALIRPGRVVLAARIFNPSGGMQLDASPSGSNFRVVRDGNNRVFLLGEWQAKVEYEMPPLPAAAPRPPIEPRLPPDERGVASTYYNGHIAPLVGYSLRGILWYQGEGNADRAFEYRTNFPLLITDWRQRWRQPELPFYFCQLPNFGAKLPAPGESPWAELREAQTLTLKLPATGMAVLVDVGEELDVHPRNKATVGERLSRIALTRNYGRDLEFSGPRYRAMERRGKEVWLRFDHAKSGLVAEPLPETYRPRSTEPAQRPLVLPRAGSPVQGFAICGADRRWQWADARIEGDAVVVRREGIDEPVAVRYAWSNNPTCNLANRAGLPASPFRTDDFPLITAANHY